MILAVTVVHAPIRFKLPLLAMITSSLAYKSIQWDNFKASTRFRKLGQFYAGFRNRATALSGPTSVLTRQAGDDRTSATAI